MDNTEKEINNKKIEKKNTKKINDNLINQNEKTNNLKTKILKKQKTIHEIKLRHLAHIENIKKNAEQKIKKIKNIEIENFFQQIMPIINVLEDILKKSKELKIHDESSIQGINLTLKSLINILLKFGVKKEGEKNEIFNPKFHDAILIQSSHKEKVNHIVSVERQGFSFNKKILRKAIVILSKN
ncbi:nucleotide exchange factor GrpE [Buchnera aphidicola]|uniref:nucleotide exchange factor GrpE n=1 Tax=Buchnera aphidicola TaxID=9 RepID=UPI00346420F1